MDYFKIYFITINIIALIVFGLDKFNAIKEKRRISEKTLILISIIGGAFGSFIAMRIFSHKIRKKRVYLPVVLFCILWSIILLYLGGRA